MAAVYATVAETSPEEFRRATEVTYLGSVWRTMAALRRMRPRNSGTIVQVGSALAYRGIPLQGAYCGGKHAPQGFLDSVRTELLHEGSTVRVTTVHLPAWNTPQFSWGRTKLPREPQPVHRFSSRRSPPRRSSGRRGTRAGMLFLGGAAAGVALAWRSRD